VTQSRDRRAASGVKLRRLADLGNIGPPADMPATDPPAAAEHRAGMHKPARGGQASGTPR